MRRPSAHGRAVGIRRCAARDLLDQLFDVADQRIVFGKRAGGVFAVDQLAVYFDVEDPASALDHLGFDLEGVLKLFRQTGGFGVVVSLHAVFDRNVHGVSLGFELSWIAGSLSLGRTGLVNAVPRALYFIPLPYWRGSVA
jgi:hypothetical protein